MMYLGISAFFSYGNQYANAGNNYTLIKKRGLFFDALYVSYLSEKQKKRRFPLIRGVFWGLISNLSALFTEEYSSMVYTFQRKA